MFLGEILLPGACELYPYLGVGVRAWVGLGVEVGVGLRVGVGIGVGIGVGVGGPVPEAPRLWDRVATLVRARIGVSVRARLGYG